MSQEWKKSVWGETRQLPSMPIQICYVSQSASASMEKNSDDFAFRLRFRPGKLHYTDASSLREPFLEVKTPSEALSFLERTGYFIGRPHGSQEDEVLTWTHFKMWQDIVSDILTNGFDMFFETSICDEDELLDHDGLNTERPMEVEKKRLILSTPESVREWLRGFPVGLYLDKSTERSPGGRPILELKVIVSTAIEAMMASYYVDQLSGINYELCARNDCQNVFELKNKHDRKFCSHKCAHTASTRARRANSKGNHNG